jgi:hypothetical protein
LAGWRAEGACLDRERKAWWRDADHAQVLSFPIVRFLELIIGKPPAVGQTPLRGKGTLEPEMIVR